jgi:hypothetical protein
VHDLAIGQDRSNLATNLLDVTVDGAIGDDALVAIHRVHELIARVDPTRMIDQHLEELELHRGEVQISPTDRGAMTVGIQPHAGLGRPSTSFHAAQDRLDPRDDLARAEGLANVIVGAELQPEQPIDLVDRTPPNARWSEAEAPASSA